VTGAQVPATGVKGSTIDITDTVTNSGLGRTPEWPNNVMTSALYLSADAVITTDDYYLGSRTYSDLLAGGSSSATTTVTIPASVPPGTYYAGAIADSNDDVFESDETNNGGTGGDTIQITAPTTGSDLVMTEVKGPKSTKAGSVISIDTTVLNQGVEGTGVELQVGIYLSTDAVIDPTDTLLATRQVPALAAGSSNSATNNVYISTQLAPGTYYLGAIADDGDWVAESNEGNNVLTGNSLKVR